METKCTYYKIKNKYKYLKLRGGGDVELIIEGIKDGFKEIIKVYEEVSQEEGIHSILHIFKSNAFGQKTTIDENK